MDIRTLKYFLAICDEGSMTRAAEVLHVTQPTLSRQISDLEREFCCELFVRHGRTLELTEKGALLRRRAQEIVGLSDQTEYDMRADSGELSGTIRIAAGESWVMGALAAKIRDFRAEHPLVKFALHTGNGEDVSWRINQGLADFAIFMGARQSSSYESIRFAQTDAWGLLTAQDHALAAKPTVAPKDLAGLPLIVSENTLDSGALSSWLSGVKDQIDVVATYTLAYNAAVLVRKDVGCALILDRIVPAGEGTGLSFRLLYPPVVSHVDFAWKRNQPLSPACQAFLAAMKEG